VTLKVILDSNFLFIPAKFQIDVFEELAKLLNQRFEPVLLSSIYQELKTMAEKGAPSRRKQASLVLKLAEKCKLVNVEKFYNTERLRPHFHTFQMQPLFIMTSD